jgi:hypothetical protein
VPVLASATYANWSAILCDVGHYDDFGTTGNAPSLSEDVEFDLAKTAGKGDLLGRGDVLIAEEDDTMIVVGPLDRARPGLFAAPRSSTCSRGGWLLWRMLDMLPSATPDVIAAVQAMLQGLAAAPANDGRVAQDELTPFPGLPCSSGPMTPVARDAARSSLLKRFPALVNARVA